MVLRGESVPAVIPDRQMEKFKFMLDYSEEAVELCTTPLAVGEQVRVIKGPLARTGRRTGDGRREKQSSRKTGYAGMRTGGNVGGVCGKEYKYKNNYKLLNIPINHFHYMPNV